MTGATDTSSLVTLLENEARAAVTRKAPAGWEPGCTWDPSRGEGEITTAGLDTEPTDLVWAELIADWGLDPARHQVVPGSVQVRGWDAPIGGGEVRRLRYYRARIVDRQVQHADVAELVKAAARRKPRAAGPVSTTHPALVVSINDWQIGKGEGGGTPATVDYLTTAWAGVLERLRELTRLGRRPSRVILANTGDLVEANTGHYASQAYTTDLNQREQLRVVRRLLMRMVDDLVTAGYPVTVTAVPCNHGENRNGDGRAYTTVDDNASLTIVEGIEEVCAANPGRYAAVDFAYARDLTLVLDICGVNVGMTHGHQIRGGGAASAAAKVEKWWTGQVMGCQPIAAADLLLTAHLHHLQISEETGRTVIIAPALDGGSYWYTSATGRTSPRGMLTLTIGSAHPRGWGDLHVT